MTEPTVSDYDAVRAGEVRDQFNVPNETHQLATLLALQCVLLQDVRFHLQNIEELIRCKF